MPDPIILEVDVKLGCLCKEHKGRAVFRSGTSCLLTVGYTCLALCLNSVLNVKAVVAAFNQEKALVGAFSVITNLRMELFQALVADLFTVTC